MTFHTLKDVIPKPTSKINQENDVVFTGFGYVKGAFFLQVIDDVKPYPIP